MKQKHTIVGDVPEITKFIANELLGGADAASVDADENLLMSGQVDSVGMMRLVAFIEEVFGTAVPPEDFTIENFKSINTIAAYVHSRKVE